MAAAALLVAGCGTTSVPDPAGDSGSRDRELVLGMRPGALPHSRGQTAAQIVGRDVVALTTFGSTSCPVVPLRVRRQGQGRLRVRVDSRPTDRGGVCSGDMAPTTVRFVVPAAATARGRLMLVLVSPGRPTVRVVARSR